MNKLTGIQNEEELIGKTIAKVLFGYECVLLFTDGTFFNPQSDDDIRINDNCELDQEARLELMISTPEEIEEEDRINKELYDKRVMGCELNQLAWLQKKYLNKKEEL